MCNVDNVGATLDPALAGLHRELGGEITAELVSKRPGDAGGLPVRRADGSLAIAEAFRVPDGFPHDSFPLFNTNTLWIDLSALEAPAEYTWCVARKSVDEREAIQFERLVGELTWWHPSRYVGRPARGRRVALRAGQGQRRPGGRTGADRGDLPRAARARRLIRDRRR